MMMANSNQRNKQLADLAAATIASDPTIKREMSQLVREIIAHQRMVMRVGSPADKTALVKAVLPQMLGAMNTVQQDEQEAEERAAYDRLRAALRGEVPVDEAPVVRIA
jgi:hypothetical protein